MAMVARDPGSEDEEKMMETREATREAKADNVVRVMTGGPTMTIRAGRTSSGRRARTTGRTREATGRRANGEIRDSTVTPNRNNGRKPTSHGPLLTIPVISHHPMVPIRPMTRPILSSSAPKPQRDHL